MNELEDHLSKFRRQTTCDRGRLNPGLDWVVFNVCTSDGWVHIPHGEISPPRITGDGGLTVEPPYSYLSFLSRDKKTVRLFHIIDDGVLARGQHPSDFVDRVCQAMAAVNKHSACCKLQSIEIVVVYGGEDGKARSHYDNFMKEKLSRVQAATGCAVTCQRWDTPTLADKVKKAVVTTDGVEPAFFLHFRSLLDIWEDMRRLFD